MQHGFTSKQINLPPPHTTLVYDTGVTLKFRNLPHSYLSLTVVVYCIVISFICCNGNYYFFPTGQASTHIESCVKQIICKKKKKTPPVNKKSAPMWIPIDQGLGVFHLNTLQNFRHVVSTYTLQAIMYIRVNEMEGSSIIQVK